MAVPVLHRLPRLPQVNRISRGLICTARHYGFHEKFCINYISYGEDIGRYADCERRVYHFPSISSDVVAFNGTDLIALGVNSRESEYKATVEGASSCTGYC